MADIVKDLLEKTYFLDLKYEDKLQIVENGRPKPELPDLKSEQIEKNRSYTRFFRVKYYEKFVWLTGSSDLNKLFCWPCLLFSNDEIGPWNGSGFSNLTYLVTACDKHQKSVNHLRAFASLQTFGSARIDCFLNLKKKIADTSHKEQVKENKIILQRLIDIVVFLGKHNCAFRKNDGPEDSRNNGMYVELLQFLATYDAVLANHLKSSTTFRCNSPLIQNVLIDAVANAISDKIKSEIAESSFVAILLDETSDVSNKSQLSTAIRYVDNEGYCQERFLHFSDISSDRTAQRLFQHISDVVDDLGCSKKLVAQTFDGATVSAGDMSDLLNMMKNKYPTASFIHCCSHRLNLVILQSTDYIKECRQFFTSLLGLHQFFSHTTSHTNALQKFTERKLPGVAPSDWNFSSKLINTLKDYRQILLEFFLSIEDEPGDWTAEEVTTASGFVRFLSRFDTKFLFIVFHRIFVYSDVLHDVLQNENIDMSYCSDKVMEFYDALQRTRNEDFEQVWTEATNLVDDDDESRPKRQKIDTDHYIRIFYEILDTVMAQTKLRFESQNCLKFMSLLDSNKFDIFCRSFPEDLLSELKEPYFTYFDKSRLKNELKVLYSMDECKSKSIDYITSYLRLNKLHIVFTEVYKLAQLLVVFPSTTSALPSSSCLQRIKAYLNATQRQVRLSNVALLSIEKDILIDLRKYSEEGFYENVILKYTQKH